MSDEVSSERVAVISAAARVPLEPDSCARVARAVMPIARRFGVEAGAIAFEIEPSSFTVIARQGVSGEGSDND
ncbi:MAG: hypothetical protein J2P54_12725 [Bradyrhizobiaceae bacterium]|nr:hypothetical protein [Bradyrhizobiaceae bacterium]